MTLLTKGVCYKLFVPTLLKCLFLARRLVTGIVLLQSYPIKPSSATYKATLCIALLSKAKRSKSKGMHRAYPLPL
jgi:hypothetical protein